MQDGDNGLLHLGDLALFEETPWISERHNLDAVACTGQRLLAEEDRVALSHLVPDEVQQWCLSRIAEYQSHNRLLRECYGVAARNAISKTKLHVRALRSAYNGAALINQHLPPEVLMEVFSYVHPAVVHQPHVPMLRVCRYWRRLLFGTPRFWANLLSLPTWKAWNPKHHMGRFQAALMRSTSESLSLSVPGPFSNETIVKILLPHAKRLSSFKVGPTLYASGLKATAQILEQSMPRLTHLAILHGWLLVRASTFDLSISRHPNIQSLDLERTHFYTPAAPYPSLCHLKLKYSAIRSRPADGSARALRSAHNALALFPNLETLSLIFSLSADDHGRNMRTLPDSNSETVYLPRLRHLELEDIPAYLPFFLSHLSFPATTSLALEPAYTRDHTRRPPPLPLFPGINPSPAPSAELSLCLYTRRDCSRDECVARWETHGSGVRPVRVALPSTGRRRDSHNAAFVTCFTRELVAALAPAPAPGVTSLDVQSNTYFITNDWKALMLELPGLRSMTCAGSCSWASKRFVLSILGARHGSSDTGGEFLCTRLARLSLGWNIPRDADLGEGGEWDSLRLQSDVDIDAPQKRLSASLSEFCDALGTCLTARVGHCERIRKLEVTMCWQYRRSERSVLEGWQVALVEQRLRHALGYLLEDIVVAAEVS